MLHFTAAEVEVGEGRAVWVLRTRGGGVVMAAALATQWHNPTLKSTSESRLEVWLEKGPKSK